MTSDGKCICKRTHAPWWGRYVPAPSCKVNVEDFRIRLFDRLLREQLEERMKHPDRDAFL